ncbi:envelope-like protein, partial [Trifolium medium]|nr:envelope-like protein [Trifolium medium]
MDLITAAGLVKTVKDLGNCYERLVKEFLANIGTEFNYPMDAEYRQVFVRGRCINFTPCLINQYLGRSTEEAAEIQVTDDEVRRTITRNQVKKWNKKQPIAATKLTAKYAILNKIAVVNWVPTTHTTSIATGLGRFIYAVGTKTKFDFGTYFFNQTLLHASSCALQLPIAFPTLLSEMILQQQPDILIGADVPCTRKGTLSLDPRLFEGSHAADIVGPSGNKSSDAKSKKQMIADL